ncbi:hypothetical protein [Roseovarius sp. D0-M9]|uniref:hypothetical protein n=1 Tax=Roseovarius sp. D0-M9 TaxID=3127117 RepID=UPI00300FE1FD
MALTYYPLPEGSLEGRNYLLFPDKLETDKLTVFHATPAINLEKIKADGLHPASKFGGMLETISYSEISRDAMIHRHYSATKTQPWVVLALRFEDRSQLYIDSGTTRSGPLKKQPEIVGVMKIPAGYETH